MIKSNTFLTDQKHEGVTAATTTKNGSVNIDGTCGNKPAGSDLAIDFSVS